MIVNGKTLLKQAPIINMKSSKKKCNGVSFGLTEAGYDIRVKQKIVLSHKKRFMIASAIEKFNMPPTLVGVVHDKSTWARKGLSVFNTVIEPGWKGYLTLELVYHGYEELIIEPGSGIAQILFSEIQNSSAYRGKYQNQEDKPVEGRFV